jgi:hypothetical protein
MNHEYYIKNKEDIIAKHKKYRQDNLDFVRAKDRERYHKNRDKKMLSAKLRYLKNKDEINKKCREERKSNKEKFHLYYLKHREKRLKENRQYHSENKVKINKRKLEYKHSNINVLLSHNLRSRLNSVVKGRQKTGSAVKDLGCTIIFLKKHLEFKFQSGMNWNNYSHNGWHIDHIKPLSLFDLTDRKQFLQACHYTNLQPLWAKENFSKHNKYATVI